MAKHLGELEHLALLALIRLRENAYGVTIRDELQERAGRKLSLGAVYSVLDRLEDKGFASSRIADGAGELGGRPRRYFTLTAKGARALTQSREALNRMWAGVEIGQARA